MDSLSILLFLFEGGREKGREGERGRETETEKDRRTDRQRQPDRQTNRSRQRERRSNISERLTRPLCFTFASVLWRVFLRR